MRFQNPARMIMVGRPGDNNRNDIFKIAQKHKIIFFEMVFLYLFLLINTFHRLSKTSGKC